MRKMSRRVRGSGGTKKKFLWKWNPKRGVLLWDALDMNNFYFLFLLFSDFIGFSFLFLFFWTMKRHVTSQSHDVTS